jgi:hypothetical protein
MPNPFSDWRDEQAAALDMSGYTVTIDPATVNPPCVVVGPIEDITAAGNDSWDVSVSVWLIHPAPAGTTALTWLESNLPAFLQKVAPFDTCELTTYAHPSGDLPAYRVAIRTTLTR